MRPDLVSPVADRRGSRYRHLIARSAAVLVGLVSVSAILELAGGARAASIDVVRAPGAEDCPDADSLARLVSERLGRDAPGSTLATPGRTIRVAFGGVEGRTGADLSWEDATGAVLAERHLTGDQGTCQGLTLAVVLAICLAIETSPAEATAKQEVPPSVDVVSPAPEPASSVGWTAGIGSGVAFGSLPQPALEIFALTGVGWKRFSIEARVTFDLPVTTVYLGEPIRTTMAFVDLAPCAHEKWLGACGLLGVGFLQASGEGLSSPTSGLTPVAFAGLRALAEIPLSSWLELEPSVEARATLSSTQLAVGGEEVWSTPPLSVAIGVALVATPGRPAR